MTPQSESAMSDEVKLLEFTAKVDALWATDKRDPAYTCKAQTALLQWMVENREHVDHFITAARLWLQQAKSENGVTKDDWTVINECRSRRQLDGYCSIGPYLLDKLIAAARKGIEAEKLLGQIEEAQPQGDADGAEIEKLLSDLNKAANVYPGIDAWTKDVCQRAFSRITKLRSLIERQAAELREKDEDNKLRKREYDIVCGEYKEVQAEIERLHKVLELIVDRKYDKEHSPLDLLRFCILDAKAALLRKDR